MKPKHLAEEGKVRLLLLKPGCHQRVTLVGSCYKVPSNIKPCKWSFINAATRTTLCATNLCTSISTSGVLKRCTNAMIVQTSDIYKMGKYLDNTIVNLPSYCTFCVMTV